MVGAIGSLDHARGLTNLGSGHPYLGRETGEFSNGRGRLVLA